MWKIGSDLITNYGNHKEGLNEKSANYEKLNTLTGHYPDEAQPSEVSLAANISFGTFTFAARSFTRLVAWKRPEFADH